jgi:hypothetical protein
VTTDNLATAPDPRAALIAGLRGLADFLAENPAMPLAWFTARVSMPGEGANDDEQRAFVDRVAAVLGITAGITGSSAHYRARREFGPVEFESFMIPAAVSARYKAENSYCGSVQVDDDAAVAA